MKDVEICVDERKIDENMQMVKRNQKAYIDGRGKDASNWIGMSKCRLEK